MNESSIWSEIYRKTEFNPGWSKPGPDRNIIHLVKDILKEYSKKEVSVLDIGCGNGRNSIIFKEISKPVIQYTGIDFSSSVIDYCKKCYGKEGNFKTQNITDPIQSTPTAFDIVLDCGCFHSIPPENRKVYVDNLVKLTQKGSSFILGTWFKSDSNLDIITPRYFPYIFIEEWLFNHTDIRLLFDPYFSLNTDIIDQNIYPDINDGFSYFVLTRNG